MQINVTDDKTAVHLSYKLVGCRRVKTVQRGHGYMSNLLVLPFWNNVISIISVFPSSTESHAAN